MRLEFDWDQAKASSNRLEHGVSFEEAMTVFLDCLACRVLIRITAKWKSYGDEAGR